MSPIRRRDVADGSSPSWADQILGAAAGLFFLAIGWLHVRLNSVERTAAASLKSQAEDAKAETLRLWASLESHRAEQQQFRERVLSDMARGKDLEAMETRLLNAMNRSAHAP